MNTIKKYDTAIFDFDGTLCDTGRGIVANLKRTLSELGRPPLRQETLEKFIGHGWIRNFGDLYKLERYREEIIHTEGFGVKSYERLHGAIEKS